MGGDFRKIDKRGMDEIISYHNVVTGDAVNQPG